MADERRTTSLGASAEYDDQSVRASALGLSAEYWPQADLRLVAAFGAALESGVGYGQDSAALLASSLGLMVEYDPGVVIRRFVPETPKHIWLVASDEGERVILRNDR